MHRLFRPAPSRIRAACAMCAALSTLLILSGIARLADPEPARAVAHGYGFPSIAAEAAPAAAQARRA